MKKTLSIIAWAILCIIGLNMFYSITNQLRPVTSWLGNNIISIFVIGIILFLIISYSFNRLPKHNK